MPSLDGVFVPVTTPFRGDEVAPERLADNLRRWSATPLAGWVVLGSTGEFPMLDAVERDRILTAAREAIPRDRCFIAGTGADSTVHTIRQTRRAAELGADVAIVITPHYFTRAFAAPAAQIRHFLTVADASPIPVLLYNFPLNTGINLEPDTVARIAAREFCEVYGLARSGRWDEARALAARMLAADRGIAGRYGLAGLKAALELQGFYGGPCRAPLGAVDGDAIEEIKEVLATAGLL
jgi:4-hydroxy-2-oxoglutarate aldolase